MQLTPAFILALNFAAAHLPSTLRRGFMARVVEALGPGKQRHAQRELGWDREVVRIGRCELHSGQPHLDHRRFNGPKPSVVQRLPDLKLHLRQIVDPQAHADPTMISDRIYCPLSVDKIVGLLIEIKGYEPTKLPSNETIRITLIDMGYTLRKVRKSKPLKKVPEADQIFETINDLNEHADACINDETLRMSMDAKARVKVGEFSRGGYSRVQRNALDHDFDADAIVVPMGIILPKYNEVYIDICHDRVTADAQVDALEAFWHEQGSRFPHTRHLLLNLDNGPENNSHRTQFLARMVEFVDNTGLIVTLAYYPPYQSKYNGMERGWGVLENHWAGELLDTVRAVVGYASTMTYNGVQAIVRLVDKVYEKGVTLSETAMRPIRARLKRAKDIPKYLVTIFPRELPVPRLPQ